jgi:hypothetical protein
VKWMLIYWNAERLVNLTAAMVSSKKHGPEV